GLSGAVELEVAEEEQAAPKRTPPPPPPPRRPDWGDRERERDRDRDRGRDWDDRPSRRRYDEDEDYPREFRERRRDTEPHRGTMVLLLGIFSLVTILISCFPVGAILGLAAWICGHSDLKKIKANQMDPEGYGSTQAGWICGIIGTLINTLATLACVSWIGFL